jgi:uncharacterized protein (TIRG00374 family)
LSRSLANRRTLVAFGAAFVLLILAMRGLRVDPHRVWQVLQHDDVKFFLIAFVVYYASFLARGERWRILMVNASEGAERERIRHYPLLGMTEILYLSWFVNCLVPARLGDLYRAYLARISVGVSMSKTVGTVLGERMLDLLVLCPLLSVSAVWAFWAYRANLPSSSRLALVGGLILAALALIVLVILWRFHRVIGDLLPRRIERIFDQLRHGALYSLRGRLIVLVGLTALIWIMEGWRLFFVLASLNLLRAGTLGLSAAIFLALGSSVLTIIFLTPGGMGGVEFFLTGTLATVFLHSVPGATSVAASAALLDRMLTYVSLVVIGFAVYLFSKKTRALGAAASLPDRAPGGLA